MSKKKIKEQQQEENLSIYEKVKKATRISSDGYTYHDSMYNELGTPSVGTDPYKLYLRIDDKIKKMEKWIENWKELKKEATQEALSQFTKEELQEALNKKQ